jgi:hypothetical protein
MKHKILVFVLVMASATWLASAQPKADIKTVELPGEYFKILEAASAIVEKRLASGKETTLAALESEPGWHHFPSAILMPAVLYAKAHSSNHRQGDQRLLDLAIRIGDLLSDEYENGHYTSRGDHDWDTYIWLEAYRIMQNKLGAERKSRWQKALLADLSLLEPKLVKCQDYPWYSAPFITTSPNHYAIYASALLVAGHVFDKPEWVKLASKVLRRFCVEEQTPDGYWGEHSRIGPTTGYDYLTSTQIALYWEYSKDPEALNALRRSTDFHKYFTYPDGTPVETINDRNRYWAVSAWGHFGFSNFPDGRRYAAFLTGALPSPGTGEDEIDMLSLGRIAQDALYYHEGKMEPIPQDQTDYAHALQVPAGIRKTGPWVVSYSGIIAPPDDLNNFFLDRQSNFSIFHKDRGLIVSGANSKRQPELATFTETLGDRTIYMPLNSRLQMGADKDRLALAYRVFFAVLEVPRPTEKMLNFKFGTTYKWGEAQSVLTLQLVLKPGEILETGAGKKITLGRDKVELQDAELGGWVRHNGWTLHLPKDAHLTWPVFPFNPYANKPEVNLERAVGTVSIPLWQGMKERGDQQFPFSLEMDLH